MRPALPLRSCLPVSPRSAAQADGAARGEPTQGPGHDHGRHPPRASPASPTPARHRQPRAGRGLARHPGRRGRQGPGAEGPATVPRPAHGTPQRHGFDYSPPATSGPAGGLLVPPSAAARHRGWWDKKVSQALKVGSEAQAHHPTSSMPLRRVASGEKDPAEFTLVFDVELLGSK